MPWPVGLITGTPINRNNEMTDVESKLQEQISAEQLQQRVSELWDQRMKFLARIRATSVSMQALLDSIPTEEPGDADEQEVVNGKFNNLNLMDEVLLDLALNVVHVEQERRATLDQLLKARQELGQEACSDCGSAQEEE